MAKITIAEQFRAGIKNIKVEVNEIKEDVVGNSLSGSEYVPVEVDILFTITFNDGSELIFNPIVGEEDGETIRNPVYLDNLGRQVE